MSTVIKVENLSKQYRLGLIGSGTLREDMEGWWYRLRGKEDPTLMLGEENDRTTVGKSNYVWALRDINFEVQQGEVLGIIGKNGAGKSTLLKLLSRVTAPTIGNIKVKGRIASLLEVGTGFHPELTGKENIFLNGAIMGMKKHEIARKLDEIIDFAGVERYLETPVKRYSSGMYVRLAFAVAAHLEPEILIVDEVLAVGDADFQKKCLNKIKSISSGDGRTVLFVSHNMTSIQNLCSSALYLLNGKTEFIGPVKSALNLYNKEGEHFSQLELSERTDRLGNGKLRAIGISMKNENDKSTVVFESGSEFHIITNIRNSAYPQSIARVSMSIDIFDSNKQKVQLYRSNFTNDDFDIREEQLTISCTVADNYLAEGIYTVSIFLGIGEVEVFDYIEDAISFSISGGDFFGTGSKGLPEQCKLLKAVTWNKYVEKAHNV